MCACKKVPSEYRLRGTGEGSTIYAVTRRTPVSGFVTRTPYPGMFEVLIR